jgi:hypothetical protein
MKRTPMDDPKNGGFATAVELRKQLLITQGAMYRSGIAVSKEAVMTGLRANTLAQGAIRQIGLAALSALRSPSGLGGSVSALVPLLFGGVAKLWRQPNWKTLVRGALVAGTVATAATIFLKRGKKQAETETETKTTED